MQPRWFRRWPLGNRKALAITLVSLVGWTLWNGSRLSEHPWGDLSRGVFTDHFSHMNAARVFPRMGLDLYRVPIAQRFEPLTPDELNRLPLDVQSGASGTGGIYRVPGWPKDKPLSVSWSHKTRMYPPGDLLLVAPIAALYHFTPLSFRGACRLLIGWFIVLAHVALFFFFRMYFADQRRGIDWLVCFVVYFQVIYYTLEGFYDVAGMVPLLLCAHYLSKRRGLAAGVAYCAGAMVHFRVFFLAPWAFVAAGQMLRNRFWRRFRWRHGLAIAVALAFAVTSLYVFALDWESLRQVVSNNPLRAEVREQNHPTVMALWIILGICGLTFVLNRAWMDLATLAWLALIVFHLREFFWWHMLVPMAWLGAPVRRPAVRAARLAFFVCLMSLVFGEVIAPAWLKLLFHPLR